MKIALLSSGPLPSLVMQMSLLSKVTIDDLPSEQNAVADVSLLRTDARFKRKDALADLAKSVGAK